MTMPNRPDELQGIPAPPVRKSHRGWAIALVILAVLSLASLTQNHENPAGPSGTSSTTTDRAAQAFVDRLPSSLVSKFCVAYAQLGYDPSQAEQAFVEGFGPPVDGVTAEQAFAELATRCSGGG